VMVARFLVDDGDNDDDDDDNDDDDNCDAVDFIVVIAL
jgi:hypothetical protein